MSFKNHRWVVFTKDKKSPMLRNYLWTKAFYKFPKLLNAPRPLLAIASRNNEVDYLADLEGFTRTHEALVENAKKDMRFVDRIIDRYCLFGEAFNNWTQQNLVDADLTTKSDEELVKLLYSFIDKQSSLYAYGGLLPLLDYQSYSFVEKNLVRILKEKLPEKEYADAFRVFTFPQHTSFAQDQEEDLLRLMHLFYDNEAWRTLAREADLATVEKAFPDFLRKLKEHTARYAWVYYVFMGPAYTKEQFFLFIKEYLQKGVIPQQQLQTWKAEQEAIVREKAAYRAKMNLDKFENTLLQLAGKVIWARPRRKDYQSKSYYHAEWLMREFARRLHITMDQALSYPPPLFAKALKQKKIDPKELEEWKAFHVVFPNDDNTVVYFKGKEAQDLVARYVAPEDDVAEQEPLSELKGSTACKGTAQGTVKIVNTSEEMGKMNQGDILISIATTPSIVPAMKKAAAIVTDEGGLTCHASIVSRELGIPCIVGTLKATKVFKDGESVKVDADQGVIRKTDA